MKRGNKKTLLGVEVENLRTKAIEVAEDLCYDKEIINKLQKATTESDITRILSDARKGVED